MSAQNDGVSRFLPIPLNAYGTAYIQGAGLVNQAGTVAIGNTKTTAGLITAPTAIYLEVQGNLIDFHTGSNTSGHVDYDARLIIADNATGAGNAKLTIDCGDLDFQTGATGRLLMRGVPGTVGQVLTCDANGVASWA